MHIPFLKKLFQKETKTLALPDSILIKKLKTIAVTNELSLYHNETLYHHAQNYKLPLMLLDTTRGLYLFETKEWSYDDLKHATIEKAQHQKSSKDTLSFQNTQEIIRQKFNELIHNDGVPIFNYLLMENLNALEYEHLADSFKELLPKKRIIFSDTSEEEIVQKLKLASISETPLPSKADIIGTLLIQYTIIDDHGNLQLATQEQREFIEAQIDSQSHLHAKKATGKSSALLLKALLYKLQYPHKQVLIIKPTKLSVDMFKRKLLESVEHAIVEVDLSTILVLTPLELINMHLQKLKKPPLTELKTTNTLVMKKSFAIADFILCDDANLLPSHFIHYLEHIQKNKPLVLVNVPTQTTQFTLTQRLQPDTRVIHFLETNPHAKALQLIAKLTTTTSCSDIVVVGERKTIENLNEDLEYFIDSSTLVLDSSKNLIDQEFSSLLLATYPDIVGLQTKHIILLDLCTIETNKLEYAFELAQESVYILYNKECEKIQTLEKHYTDNKE